MSGTLFLSLLARLIGVGRAVYLTMFGGTAGNALTVVWRGTAVVSMGFPTAFFAVVGALAGVMSLQRRGGRNMFLPVAAGVGLLVLLGYGRGTHGLCGTCGRAGLRTRPGHVRSCSPGKRGWPALPQIAASLLALTLPVLAWWRAFV